jgi:hypothetical protein
MNTRYAKSQEDISGQREVRLAERREDIAKTAIELYDRIERVENLHNAVKIGTSGMAYCGHCSEYNAGHTVMYPCPTLQILLND